MRVLLKGVFIGVLFKLALAIGDVGFYVAMAQRGYLEGNLATCLEYWAWISSPLSQLYQLLFVRQTATVDGGAMAVFTKGDDVIICLTWALFYPIVGMVVFWVWAKKRDRAILR